MSSSAESDFSLRFMSQFKTIVTLSMIALLMGSICWLARPPHEPLRSKVPGEKLTAVASHQALPNLQELADGVYSGGQPDGKKGYQQLAELGVKTVISVDGARPSVELAREFGLTYIHLPHGYDGIEVEHAVKLAKAVESVGEPVYIHCHHGKHRSPAAAAVACVGLNRVTADEAMEFLKQAGTSVEYQGLYRSVEQSVPFSKATLDDAEDSFPEVAPLTPLVQSMVRIEKHFDSLSKLIQRDGEQLPSEPDLDATHEALLLFEHFTELRRQSSSFDSGYDELMLSSQQNAESLHRLLTDSKKEFPRLPATELLGLIRQDCKRCHRTYRD